MRQSVDYDSKGRGFWTFTALLSLSRLGKLIGTQGQCIERVIGIVFDIGRMPPSQSENKSPINRAYRMN